MAGTDNKMSAVEVDGSILEGGGQVLRNCAAYAAIFGKPVHFVKIRANRPKPGLRPQHLEGLKLVENLTNGTLVDAIVNSQDVWFTPGQVFSDLRASSDSDKLSKYEADTKTAGACSLLLQVSLPILLFSRSSTELVLKGGTNVAFSPPVDYMKHVLVPMLHKHFNVMVDIEIVRRGFNPIGGGIVVVKVHPVKLLPPISLCDRGLVVHIAAKLYGYGRVDQQFVNNVEETLASMLHKNKVDAELNFSSDMQGMETKAKLACGLFLFAETSTGCILGGGSLGGRDSKPERLTSLAVQDLVKQLSDGGCTDEHLQDQLIIFMALAKGVSEIMTGPITLHTETAIHFAHHMTNAKFTVTPIPGSCRNLIRCENK